MQKYLSLLLSIIILTFVSCSKDNTPSIAEGIFLSSQTLKMEARPNVPAEFEFTCSEDWTIENPTNKIMTVTPTSGKAGNATVSVTWLYTNQGNSDRDLSFTIRCNNSNVSKEVKVTQKPVFEVEKTNYKIKSDSCVVTVSYKCNYNVQEPYIILTTDEFKQFCEFEEFTPTQVKIKVHENDTKRLREGVFVLQVGDAEESEDDRSHHIFITQEFRDVSVSKDYSQDGKVTLLQTHTEGQGVPIVVMGDGFVDTDIADGTYEKTLREASEKLFTLEPMTSLRPYFDLYLVNAVSMHNQIADDYSTAFKTVFEGGVSTLVVSDRDICTQYALKAISKEQLENALVLVILNDTRDAGTCDMDVDKARNGSPTGASFAYVPMGEYYENTLHHEVIGHGLGKLDDEYGSGSIFYEALGSILDSKNAKYLELLKAYQSECAMLNVSLESEIEKTPWYEFSKDSRYASEEIGMYEGADTFPYGVYRSTENSLMFGSDDLNAISRCLLYKRIMNIAYNFEWNYDYETFVKFDEPARKATRKVSAPVDKTWRVSRSRPIIRLKN